MSKRPLLFRQTSFSGGMVQRHSRELLQPNEVEWLENFEISERGHAVVRTGFVQLGNQLPAAVAGLIDHVSTNGTLRLFAFAGGNIYLFNYATSLWDQVATGLPAAFTGRYNLIPYGDDIIILNYSQAPRKFNVGTNAVSLIGGSPPNAGVGAIYYNHLFLGLVPNEPARIYYSETANIDAGYGGTNYFFDLSGSDNTAVTGLLSREYELIIGRGGSITRVTGFEPRDFSRPQNQAVHSEAVGTVGPMISVDGETWFLGLDGIYSISGGGRVTKQTWAVDAIFDDLSHTDDASFFWDPTRRQVHLWGAATGATHTLRNTALVGYPGQGRGGLAAWSLWSGEGTRPLATLGTVPHTLSAATGRPILLGTSGGIVYQSQDIFDPAVKSVRTAVLRSGPQEFSDPSAVKLLRQMRAQFDVTENIDFRVSYENELGETATLTDALTAGAALTSKEARFNVSPKGRRFWMSVMSQNPNTNLQDIRVTALEMLAYEYGRKLESSS